ncbi:hypothetical protein CPIN18021_0283 [Campylobacter pinnipediorum subsp. caledonicus]|uniref:Uncharacterized protein n=1 Tax=Campylobacter pinnipediorum subsp. caledonicus TaxID=1874362 RepID=A0A1S6U635_9BACT|nr:hypothetical protein [Campylobacter pinnipediorum]AQW85545.1 hypothetical protein CPIN18020_0304 [Campylobacter pinnipediorum subsp. caledonicus]AQW87130.1 hypothetical protein CPIN18021_0283 [Campylobacter pinnipediorum subsp. caledonicus]OPA71828.1 hypothetical protein BB381_06740 [Campylobacter pinnipediorum subsp. caledonicus]
MSTYSEEYKKILKEVLALSVEENSPYNKTIAFFEEKFNEYQLSANERIRVFAEMLPVMTTSFTTTAMQISIELANQSLSFDTNLDNLKKQGESLTANIEGIKEQTKGTQIKNEEAQEQRPDKLANLHKQGLMLDAQIAKLAQEQTLAEEQHKAIKEQVKDNKLIKGANIIENLITGNQQGGLVVPTDMSRYLFDLVGKLVEAGATPNKPSTYTMTKRS